MAYKEIKKRSIKKCSICTRDIWLTQYKGGRYRGGHYFGKIPLFRKKELDIAHRTGVVKCHIGDMVVDVLKKDPKPYAYAEHWECPKCYGGLNFCYCSLIIQRYCFPMMLRDRL